MIALSINGEPRRVPAESVEALLRAEGLDPTRRGIAVAVNGQVIRRDDWRRATLAEGDRVEIVRAVSGG